MNIRFYFNFPKYIYSSFFIYRVYAIEISFHSTACHNKVYRTIHAKCHIMICGISNAITSPYFMTKTHDAHKYMPFEACIMPYEIPSFL